MTRWNGRRRQTGAVVAALTLVQWTQATPEPRATPSSTTFSAGYRARFVELSGEELYVNVCQSCHMVDARGATGAGTYPSLADDPRLEEKSYVVDLVVNGRRAMPPFAALMSNGQIAAVVNYLRTNFGNDYRDMVTDAAVEAARR